MSKKLPISLKPFIGKIFVLRNRSLITVSPISKDGQSYLCPRNDFNDVVFIIDETNRKVRVLKKDGTAIWIAKYNLGKEISTIKMVNLEEVLNTIKMLTSRIGTNLTSDECEKIRLSISTLKSLIEKEKNKNNTEELD